MIFYEPKKNWIKDIIYSAKSETIRHLLWRLLLVTALSSINIYFLVNYQYVGSFISKDFFTLIGVALSILMVFRTNTAYDRWWSGRKYWGELVNNSRSMALLIDAKLPKHDESNRRFFARNISNYAFALCGHLRGVFTKDLLYDVGYNDEKQLEIHSHAPNYIAKKLYNRTVRLLDQGHISNFVELKMLDHLAELNTITGGCERIRNTPIPFSYRIYLKLFIAVYTILIPFVYAQSLGYYAILLISLEFFILVGLEMLAEEIENPFEQDGNDLPTRSISFTIKNNVYEILGFYEEVEHPHTQKLYNIVD